MERSALEQMVESLGGKNLTRVTKELQYLVVGKNPSSKLEKASMLSVRTLDEEQFLELISGAQRSLIA
jgi:DNA ligase (NAD+)